MKYVSPTTEMRRQQNKKRKQQKTVGAILVFVAIIVGAVALKLMLPKGDSTGDKPVISTPGTQPEATPDTQPEATPGTQPEATPDTQPEATPDTAKPSATPKATPKPKKEPWFSFKLPSFFTKEEEEGESFPVTAFGRTVEQGAKSIASLSPTATEAILSSPAQGVLVAVSEYCNKRGQELMTVGTPLIPNVDKIITLAPEYLIIQSPLSDGDKNKIEQSGIKILQISSPKSMEDIKEIYRSISAVVLGKTKATNTSENIIYDIETKLKMYEFSLSGAQKQTVVLLFNKYGMAATQDTVEAEFIKPFFQLANGGNNYFPGTREELVATNPQVIIAPDTFSDEDVIAMGFGDSAAVQNGKVFFVPIQDFENYSPKMIKHLAEIAGSVYEGQFQIVTTQDIYPDGKADKKADKKADEKSDEKKK